MHVKPSLAFSYLLELKDTLAVMSIESQNMTVGGQVASWVMAAPGFSNLGFFFLNFFFFNFECDNVRESNTAKCS